MYLEMLAFVPRVSDDRHTHESGGPLTCSYFQRAREGKPVTWTRGRNAVHRAPLQPVMVNFGMNSRRMSALLGRNRSSSRNSRNVGQRGKYVRRLRRDRGSRAPEALPYVPNTNALAPHGEEPRRVLVLMSDTGGGHRASAEALQNALLELHPNGVEIHIVDFFVSIAGPPFLDTLPQTYSTLAKFPFLWRLVWLGGLFWPTRAAFDALINRQASSHFDSLIDELQPHLVVSVHPLTQHVPLKVLQKRLSDDPTRRPIPFCTVVTDLGSAAPGWFSGEADLTVVPSERVAAIARRHGVPDSRLRLIGLPVRSQFWNKPGDKDKARQKKALSLPDARTPTVLVVGGGDGVGGLAAITKRVARELHASLGAEGAQLVIVCGRNTELRDTLLSYSFPIPTRVEGFVTNMRDLMVASDVIVTKAGKFLSFFCFFFLQAAPVGKHGGGVL